MIDEIISVGKSSINLLVPKMPLIGQSYGKTEILKDVIAGATVAAVLIPQSMAYALLAGLPPAHGLYAAFFGGIAGSLWSNSRFLATGPVAVVSLLTFTAVSPLAPSGSATFIALCAALALMVGLMQIGIGFLRLGFLVRLVPLSVLTGFSIAAALLIITTQIPNLLGFKVISGDFAFVYILNIVRHIFASNSVTLLLGFSTLILLLIFRKFTPRFPATLLVLVLGILAAYALELERFGVAVAGAIPTALPVTDIPNVSLSLIVTLSFNAFMIACVGFMTSYAVLKDIAQRNGGRVDPDQELMAQGFANLGAGLFRGVPVGGSLSRTALNYNAGAATAWSGVYAALFVLFAIVFLSPILAYIPNTVLAAIVIAAVWPLLNLHPLRDFFTVTKTDGIIALATFLAVFFMRPDEALLLGVILALALYMKKVMWTDSVEVGIHPIHGTMHIREAFPEVPQYPGILMLRLDSPLFYANAEHLSQDIKAKVAAREKMERRPVAMLVLDFSGVNHVDVTGISDFSLLMSSLAERGISTKIISLKIVARKTLERGGALKHITILNNVEELKAVVAEFQSERHGVQIPKVVTL